MKLFFSYFLTILAMGLTGCGYQFGSMMHPQIKSVAVAPVTNETLSYNAAAQMRGLLCEIFTTDQSLKLTSMEKADCILYAKVLKVKYSEVSWSQLREQNDQYQPNQWRCDVTVEYSVILPGRGTPLVKPTTVSGFSEFVGGADLETVRLTGMKQAMYEAAKNIVSNFTEAW